MPKTDKNQGQPKSATDKLKKDQAIHLSLFDPCMPELELGGRRTGASGGKSICQCEVRVRETDEEGFVISMPPCNQARECMQENRVLYALLGDVGRSSFLTTVQPLGEGLSESDGMIRLTNPERVSSCQKRDNYRTKIFPLKHCLVYAWPIKTMANADDAVQAYLRGDVWQDERLPPKSRDHAGRSVLIDMSARGAGVAVGVTEEFPAPLLESMLLLRLHLDPSERPLVCPVRVRWIKPMSTGVVRVGVEMMIKSYPRLEKLIDNQVGPWLAAMQREKLSSRPVETLNDAG